MQEIIWSVCQDSNCSQLQGFVKSLRDNGYDGRIIVWSEFEIAGAETRPIDSSIILDQGGMWKFEYMKRLSQTESNSIFAYFSPNHYAVKALPSSFQKLLGDNNVMCFLEANIVGNNVIRKSWMNINNYSIYDMAKSFGLVSDSFYNLNANHFIIKSDYVQKFINLRNEIPDYIRKRGYNPSDEFILSMIINTVSSNTEAMTISNNDPWYAIDWKGFFKGKLPNSNPWESEDYFTGKTRTASPSIIMCPSSGDALYNFGKNLLGKRIVSELSKPLAKGCASCQRSKPQVEVIPAQKG